MSIPSDRVGRHPGDDHLGPSYDLFAADEAGALDRHDGAVELRVVHIARAGGAVPRRVERVALTYGHAFDPRARDDLGQLVGDRRQELGYVCWIRRVPLRLAPDQVIEAVERCAHRLERGLQLAVAQALVLLVEPVDDAFTVCGPVVLAARRLGEAGQHTVYPFERSLDDPIGGSRRGLGPVFGGRGVIGHGSTTITLSERTRHSPLCPCPDPDTSLIGTSLGSGGITHQSRLTDG